ncbi:signal peptidase II [Desulfohalotomaculum tongense]|uniref:signal peptidase II n=1 Tax=Desulforadius tongensis TaxID=1216062 RepID=UPI0030841A7F|nr:signal peptidase II [Desulforadius tongensis]
MMPLIFTALVVLTIDLLSKYIVQSNMELYQSIPVVENIFHITYILNPGAAFGMLAYKTSFFVAVSAALILGVVFFYRRIARETLLVKLSLGMVAGGAVGNLIDRIRYGKVVDFLDFRVWPVFNLADTAIVIGVGLLILEIMRRPEQQDMEGEK